MRLGHRAWYVATLLASLLFLLLLPPLQSNDETLHWGRAWSVAFDGPRCRTVPAVGWLFPGIVDVHGVLAGKPYRFANLDAARAVKGSEERRPAWGACYYSPLAYLLPGAAMRLVATPSDPSRPAGLVAAFYAARVANWALMAVAVLWFLLRVPELRNLTLVLYSLPMVMQQTISINQDSTIFLLMFALVYVMLQPPSVRQLVALASVVAALTLIKLVYFPLVLLFVAGWLRLRRDGKPMARARWWALAALALLPLVVVLAWNRWNAGVPPGLPKGIDPGQQLAYVRAHPLRFAGALGHQVLDFFGRGKMNGGWPSVFGLLGWAAHDIGDRALRALGCAVVIALLADGVHAPRAGRPLRLVGDAILPLVAAFGVALGTAVAMYIVFTGVGLPYIVGMQGRYLHVPLYLSLAVGLFWVQARWHHTRAIAAVARAAPLLPWLAFGLCAIGVVDALATLGRVYY